MQKENPIDKTDFEIPQSVLDSINTFQTMYNNGNLWKYISNLQITAATFYKNYSLSEEDFNVIDVIKTNLKKGICPSRREMLLLALKVETVFKPENKEVIVATLLQAGLFEE